ncbi:MAG: PSD1 and planctomycete cytochrome C domain-containing protein [Pirellulales bacterium]|nr:PSD1 and planctomycete cytochrome C domain-containing protein [Pirellulales bacterium]
MAWLQAVVFGPAASAAAPDFEDEVAPLLVKRCLECHNATQAAGGLVLESRESLSSGGESGPAVVPGSAAESYLMERVAAGEMPPEKQRKSQALPASEIELLRRWIEAGTEWPAERRLSLFERTTDQRAGRDWWSLQPLQRPPAPDIGRDAGMVSNPLDAFVLARLRAVNMEPAPRADARTLVRRLSFDLLGLPPTEQQLQSYAADPSPAAWERLVDEMLASPHYGERWARYWLDVVRFAETSGYERDQEKPFAWRYRDWVVAALNDDLPYDEFIVEQLAGDEVPNRSEQTVIATGFLRLGTWNDEPNDPEDYKYDRLEDLVHGTSAAFLGLTVNCARCHDHKFDPIPQQDYYRMAAAFWAGPIEQRGADLLGGPSAAELGFEKVLGWTDVRSDPPPLHLLKKGERHNPGEAVPAAPLSFASVPDRPLDGPVPERKSTGRRLRLARWIASAENPLTARVMVNRLWQHHFGQALVRSPSNFGFRGDQPTHPELLDWLAAELIGSGWKSKRLHKLIVTSRTWQQSSNHPRHAEFVQQDAGNRLWWRAERRRLDAEALWDAMLVASGQLDVRMGGPSFRPTLPPEALEGLSKKGAAWTPSPIEEQYRRGLYIFSQRSLLAPFMTTFDFSDTTLPCAARDVTIVAPQALALLNDPMVHERSRALAARVAREGSQLDASGKVCLAWRCAIGREPTTDELNLSLRHVERQQAMFAARAANGATDLDAARLALESLCHVLLNSNEFLYVD